MAQETTGWTRDDMAARAAKELEDGYYVTLGIGIPTIVANHVPTGMTVTLQSEHAMHGIGPFPFQGDADPDLIDRTSVGHGKRVSIRVARGGVRVINKKH